MAISASGKAARISSSISLAAIGTLVALLHDLAARFNRLVVERLADLRLVGVDPGRGQVAEDLADDIVITGLFEISADDILGVGGRLLFAQAHQAGGPLPKQPVAAGDDAELHFLVASIFALECPLAVVKGGHRCSLLCLPAR